MTTFEDAFGFPPQASSQAPGRVNLLGEHTDYNDGFVLPTAIPQHTSVQAGLSRDAHFRFHSHDLAEAVSYREGSEPQGGFARYIHGCIAVLRERGYPCPAVSMFVRSEVPIGCGLSSSAALEVAVLRALRALLGLSLDDLAIAQIAQQAETRFAHVPCGIMDQMASSLADRSHILFIDTRTLERRLLPLPAGAEVVVLDSGVPRTLAASGYSERHKQCMDAAQMLNVTALRDIHDVADAQRLPAPLDRRARHVITENQRVLDAIAPGTDAVTFGKLMNASHVSLRDDFEVSIPALDELVATLQRHPDVLGARLTGAGFGGACVALVSAGSAPRVKSQVLRDFGHQHRGARALV